MHDAFYLRKNIKCVSRFSDLGLFMTSLFLWKLGTIPQGNDFNSHFNLLRTILSNLRILFQSFSN